ncbi:MAG: CatB-related O-acetyltransferase [Janthinobacterium lividum]
MKEYIDTSFLINPIYEYFKWIKVKIFYQVKYWGKHLRISYNSYVANVEFGNNNYIGKNTYLTDSIVGDFTYLSYNCTVTNTYCGKFCSIGPNVKIAPGRHPTSKFVSTHPSLFSNPSFLTYSFTKQTVYQGNLKVNIGNDVWIGANCIILDGVTIADGAIIAANSVVTKDVAPYQIVGGTPAKFIKKRFDDEEIIALLEFKWWDKDYIWIKNNVNQFWDIKSFITTIQS